MKSIYLKKDEERRLLAGHLWIFSNEIDVSKTSFADFVAGDLVYVKTSSGRNLGIAYFNPQVLMSGRLLTRDHTVAIDVEFFKQKINQALQLRKELFPEPYYRLIFGESDGLPGLIVDRYNDILVGQISTWGMESLKNIIAEALVAILKPVGILWRNDVGSREVEGLPLNVEKAYGEIPQEIEICENQTKFLVPFFTGQKTGWFYDQTQNRKLMIPYIKNKKVLDVFSYLGGWGITAASHGAKEVVCVDSSKTALDFITKNAELNNVSPKVKPILAEVFAVLKELAIANEKFEVIILDPPAFIKKRKDIKNGMEAYQRLHELALKLLLPGGFLITCSCSMHFERADFINTIRRAGLKTGCELRILSQLHQSQDHPIHPAIKETEYLKGFVVGIGRSNVQVEYNFLT